MLVILGLLLAPMILSGTRAFAVRNAARPPRRNCAFRSPHPATTRRVASFFFHHPFHAFTSVASTRNHESDSEGDVSLRLVDDVAKNLHTIRSAAVASQFPHLGDASSATVALSAEPRTVYLLGVSGGSDSVALLHLMMECIRRYDAGMRESTSLHVVHFDHQQRGVDSTKDCEFVRRLCRDHGLPCHVYAWNTEAGANCSAWYAQQQPQPQPPAFSQDTARKWRRRTMWHLLSDLVRVWPTPESVEGAPMGEPMLPTVGILLTAHHLDDSNESMLLKLLRGTHLTNLQGMAMVHIDDEINNDGIDIDGDASRPAPTTWGRPLLSVRKSQLLEFLTSRGLAWREDASNQSSKYLRNRVRNELVPLLADLASHGGNGGGDGATALQTRLDRMSQQSREVQEYLDAQSDLYVQRQQHLQETIGGAGSGDGVFHLLPSTKQSRVYGHHGEVELDLMARHALHRWLARRQAQLSSRRTDKESSRYISYDHIQLIWRQLQEHAHNQCWRLDIGEGWTVVRLGNVLLLEDSTLEHMSADDRGFQNVEVKWASEEYQDQSGLPLQNDRAALVLHVPSEIAARKSVRLYSATLASSPERLSFRPPWRENAIPLKDFLRGQKVPLHQRPHTPLVLFCESQADDAAVEVAAVRVTHKDQWVVHAQFAKATDGTSPIRILGAGVASASSS
jgi:tRNA(Ile)-lysidine synthetase-like protein